VTAYAKILHIGCVGAGLGGVLGGDAATGHTTCDHISGHVECLVPLQQNVGQTCDMPARFGIGHPALPQELGYG
jgi:hypothetical protein